METEMRTKFALATTAAMFLAAAGMAQAQQTTPSPNGTAGSSTLHNQSMPSGTTGSTSTHAAGALDRGTLHEVKDNNAMAKDLNVNVRDLEAMAIYGSDGKKIGEVKNVLADSSNDIKAVTADVGGFLGMGAREVVIPIDKLKKGTEKDRLQTAMTKDEIQKLENWSDNGRSTNGNSMNRSTTSTPNAPAERSAPSTAPSSR
jgi:ribosomal 30S subunit maturation factor RimM